MTIALPIRENDLTHILGLSIAERSYCHMRFKSLSSSLLVGIFTISLLAFPSLLLAENQATKPQAPLFDNLGSFHFPISTKIPLAQRFFDQGLIFYYGFEWGESIRSFKEAARLDPNCGMCYWGLALALGSKINAPMSGHEYADAKIAIREALSHKEYAVSFEQAYINALALRFQHQPKKTIPSTGTFSCHIANTTFDSSTKQEILNYAQAMKQVTETYPSDNNAKALYAYALFDTVGWSFWDSHKKINPITPDLIATIKSILSNDKLHIGGNHYYVHVIEQSPKPEDALESANRLRTLVPGSEHLVHMPTHIYFLTGQYHEGSQSNIQAIAAFKTYNQICHAQGFGPEINYLYLHNYDFLRTTAAMEGRRQLALSAAQEMLEPPFPAWLANDPSLQWFIPIPYFVEARFGMWDNILKESKPNEKYQYALGMWHYARGLAFAHAGNITVAKNESSALKKIIDKGPADNNLQKNGIHLLKIADSILKATLANIQGNENLTISHLKTAIKIQDDMGYHEPPDWYFPAKEALGDAYLHWNHPKQAINMYEQDLKQYPKNGWALFGLAKSLRQLGKNQAADHIENEFKEAWKYSDIPAPISLFSLENSSARKTNDH